MEPYGEKFNQIFNKSTAIDIQFIDDNPLSVKIVRYNQSGEVCHRREGDSQAQTKVNNEWKNIECTSSCQYLQKDKNGKKQCNRIAWLKFIIPQISNSRIWLMKITGQESIDNLKNYILFQKAQGNSLKNIHTLFLFQKEQSNSLGQTFNNYILDIVDKNDFDSNNLIHNQSQNVTTVSTQNAQNVNNSVQIQEKIEDNSEQNIPENTNKKDSSKDKNYTKTKGKKTSKSKGENDTPKEESSLPSSLEDCYILLETYADTITDKNGQPKSYLIGKFTDMHDKEMNIAIKPEDAEELSQCDLGTVVKIDIKNVLGKDFAVDLQFIEKRVKKIAA